MKVMVTGASGFLGAALCKALKAQGHRLTLLNSKNCDLTCGDSLGYFNADAYDCIYHLAAWTQAGDFCLYHPGEQWIINQQINTNMLAWWSQSQPQAKLICMGTSCAYATDHELIEENYMLGRPTESLLTYAMTKRMLYAGLLALHQQFGMKYLCLVPSTLYGPGYHRNGRQMHFIFDLVYKILRGKLYGDPVILWGDGYQTRELVFLDDFVKITLRLAETVENDLINVGAGAEYSIRHFARLICQKVGYDFNEIQFDPSRYVGARSKCLAVGKLRGYLPDLVLTPLEVGLDKTIDWFWAERDKLLLENRL